MDSVGAKSASGTGRIFGITGVSGSGKGTIVRALESKYPDLWLSVSATTRAPRPGDLDGVDYHFVSEPEFERMISEGELLEWEEVFGNRYGTPLAPIGEAIAAGRDVILETEVKGAEFIKKTWPHSRVVFLRLADSTVQRERLVGRGTTGPDLERRITDAAEQLARADEFDAVVVNDELSDAILQVEAILGLSAS